MVPEAGDLSSLLLAQTIALVYATNVSMFIYESAKAAGMGDQLLKKR